MLWVIWQDSRGLGMPRLLRAFEDAGVDSAAVQRFLDSEPHPGDGTIRDHVAADMANQLLDALGQPASQSSRTTKELRARGAWRKYDERPEE